MSIKKRKRREVRYTMREIGKAWDESYYIPGLWSVSFFAKSLRRALRRNASKRKPKK